MDSDYTINDYFNSDKKDKKPILKCKCDDNIPPNQVNSACRPCEPVELIRNGGFEEFGAFELFAGWLQEADDIRIGDSLIAHEGTGSVSFNSLPTPEIEEKTARLFQNTTVNPGCFLILSYATNFLNAGTDFAELNFRARVYYGNTTQTNLINIETQYASDALADKGFDFHQGVSNVPVPPNVTNVTVEFQIQITDKTAPDNRTQFLLDSVSLRAI